MNRHLQLCTLAMSVVFLSQAAVSAATIEIGLLGLDLIYDGTALKGPDTSTTDDEAPDPSADKLDAVSFRVDGVLAGPVFTSPGDDLEANIFIPVDIPSVGMGSIFSTATSGEGIFDLHIPSGAALILDVEDVTVNFLDAGIAQFVFGAEITSDLIDQGLPFGLTIGTPIDISFNATIEPGTLTEAGGFVTGFAASGSANISGPLVPEPTSAAMLTLLLATAVRCRQRS